MGTYNANSIPDTDTTKRPPTNKLTTLEKDVGPHAHFNTGTQERGEPVLNGMSGGIVEYTNNGMKRLLTGSDIAVIKTIEDMNNLSQDQKNVVESIRVLLSETSAYKGISDEGIMDIIETFKQPNSLHARTFGMPVKGN